MPLYQQIYEYIKSEITDGKISPGEKLPSTRLLANNLMVSRSTVDLAYDQLLSEGYVRTVPCSGYFVCELETGFAEGDSRKKEMLRNRSKNLDGSRGWTEAVYGGFVSSETSRFSCDFSPNAIEWSDFSMASWRKAIKSMLQDEMEELFQPGSSQGEENLRQAICDYLHRARGVNCNIHQIIIGAGNEYLLMLLYQMMGADQRVAMESPTYRQAYQIFRNLGWTAEPVPMDEYGMMLDGLRESGAKLAYIMPSHQFPLGNVMPMKRRTQLLQWAGEENGRYIIEDDYDSEFRYKGKPIPSLQGSDPYDCVIYLGTFSKSIAPAIRVSYMVLPPELMLLYQGRCGFYSSTVSRIQQQILYYFMKDGYFERHLNKMRGIYRARHDVLLAELKGKRWVKCIYGENAGLHVLVEVNTLKTEEQLIEEAKSAGIRMYGLKEYAIEETVPEDGKVYTAHPTLLLGYAGLSEEKIREGIRGLEEII